MSILITPNLHGALEKANTHMTHFIDSREQKVLPLPFFSHEMNSKLFFSPLEKHFSENQMMFLKKDYQFFGEVITLKTSGTTRFIKEIISLQKLYSITPEHLHAYAKVKEKLNLLQIGNIMDLSVVRPLIGENGITADTPIASPFLKEALLANPTFATYWYVVYFEWTQKNYKEILR